MRTNIEEQEPRLKELVLRELIPAFTEKEIAEMTGLNRGTVGYYRRTRQIPTFLARRKLRNEEAQEIIKAREQADREYAEQNVIETLRDYGINVE